LIVLFDAAIPPVTIGRVGRKKGRFASGHFCRNDWFCRLVRRMVGRRGVDNIVFLHQLFETLPGEFNYDLVS
jgi:hypothetical protein